MTAGSGTLRRDLRITNKRGLHARAAARFVRVAEQFSADINVVKGDLTVSGTSIMGLMLLGAAKGSWIVVTASGAEAEVALRALATLTEAGFDEGS